MPPPEEAALVTEPSIADLRTMLKPALEAPVKEAPAATEAKATEAKTAPATEPVTEEATRDDKGQFKPKKDDTSEEPPVPAGVQKRIDKAVRAQREAERRVEELEAKLKTGSQPATETAKPAEAPKKPELSQFETYEAFDTARDKYLEDLAEFKAQAAISSSEQKRAQAEAAKSSSDLWKARAAAVIAKHPDYDEALKEAATLPISKAMHECITDAGNEHGPELAYYFATNPDDTARVFALPESAQRREIAKIELKFVTPEKPSSPPAKPVAKPLPKPPAAVGGSHSPSVVDLNDQNLDMVTFKREFRKRLAS